MAKTSGTERMLAQPFAVFMPRADHFRFRQIPVLRAKLFALRGRNFKIAHADKRNEIALKINAHS